MRQHRSKGEAQQRKRNRHGNHLTAPTLPRNNPDDRLAHRSLPASRSHLSFSHDPDVERHADSVIKPGLRERQAQILNCDTLISERYNAAPNASENLNDN